MYVLENVQTEILDEPMQGIVQRVIAGHQPGRIKVMGVSWGARLYHSKTGEVVAPGKVVMVVGRQGNTLLVVSA